MTVKTKLFFLTCTFIFICNFFLALFFSQTQLNFLSFFINDFCLALRSLTIKPIVNIKIKDLLNIVFLCLRCDKCYFLIGENRLYDTFSSSFVYFLAVIKLCSFFIIFCVLSFCLFVFYVFAFYVLASWFIDLWITFFNQTYRLVNFVWI